LAPFERFHCGIPVHKLEASRFDGEFLPQAAGIGGLPCSSSIATACW
jgi:hypothetical protein